MMGANQSKSHRHRRTPSYGRVPHTDDYPASRSRGQGYEGNGRAYADDFNPYTGGRSAGPSPYDADPYTAGRGGYSPYGDDPYTAGRYPSLHANHPYTAGRSSRSRYTDAFRSAGGRACCVFDDENCTDDDEVVHHPARPGREEFGRGAYNPYVAGSGREGGGPQPLRREMPLSSGIPYGKKGGRKKRVDVDAERQAFVRRR